MGTYIIIDCARLASQNITINNAYILTTHVALHQCGNGFANQNVCIGWVRHFATTNGNSPAKINFTCIEQMPEEDDCTWVNSPNNLTLVDRGNVVDLNTYITSRALAIKDVQFNILDIYQCICFLIGTNTQVSLCNLR